MEIDSPDRPDVIASLGYLCLGSRLKRLGERMQAGVAALLAEQGHDVQPAQLPLLMALHLEGEMTIGQLGERVGFSQPGVSRAIAALEDLGMVSVSQAGPDKRQRSVGLTMAARARMDDFNDDFFPFVDRAVAQLCGAGEADLLGELAAIESRLASEPLDARIRRVMHVPVAEHVLDRAAWHALTGPQADHALGGPLAKRFHPDIGPLAAPRDHSPEALAALAALAPAEGVLATILVQPMDLPPTVDVVRCSPALQMVMDAPPAPFDHPDIEMLTAADAAEMRALAELTEPGPFSSRTHELGTFWGVREHGRIVAMAGERMRLPGYGEVSAVCVHPDARGRGLGALLTRKAAATVGARGLTPFLHVYADNAPAIATYERVGFRVRSDVIITMLTSVAG
jgi:ribosomal protein S18 acetylase RimI-like enzyme/DNA-binding MarR family transcriptional regulator